MPSQKLHAPIHASIHHTCRDSRIDAHRGERQASGGIEPPPQAPSAHLLCMSNHTIAAPITTWAASRTADREVLNRAEVAALLAIDPRTVDQAISDGTIPAIRPGRRVLIPSPPVHGCLRCARGGIGMTGGRRRPPSAGGRREKGSGSISSYATKAGDPMALRGRRPGRPDAPGPDRRHHPAWLADGVEAHLG